MYINKTEIEKSPMFRMEGGKFSLLVSKIKPEKESEDDIEAVVSFIVRTDRTNEVMKHEDSVVFTNEIYRGMNNKYMSLMASSKVLLYDLATDEFVTEDVKKTVLMPVGVFIHEDKLHFYFNLIIKDEIKHIFKYDFDNIEDLPLNKLDDKSIIILPTLVKTK